MSERAPGYDVNWQKTTACVEWAGWKDRAGYGLRRFNGKKECFAHRVAWEIAFGPIPEGMCVCHRCDNPPCVNVEHLFLGTQLENMRDRQAKGRGHSSRNRGESNPSAKLDIAAVAVIRATAGTPNQIAEYYGVSQATIRFIQNGKRWSARAEGAMR